MSNYDLILAFYEAKYSKTKRYESNNKKQQLRKNYNPMEKVTYKKVVRLIYICLLLCFRTSKNCLQDNKIPLQ